MRHQFLVAKQEYLDLMGARQDLERQRVDTQLALYQRLLDRIRPWSRSPSGERRPSPVSRTPSPRST
jgi:hypothetical protein